MDEEQKGENGDGDYIYIVYQDVFAELPRSKGQGHLIFF